MLNENDIQRAYRSEQPKNKARPIIVRFVSYKKRCKLLFSEKN